MESVVFSGAPHGVVATLNLNKGQDVTYKRMRI